MRDVFLHLAPFVAFPLPLVLAGVGCDCGSTCSLVVLVLPRLGAVRLILETAEGLWTLRTSVISPYSLRMRVGDLHGLIDIFTTAILVVSLTSDEVAVTCEVEGPGTHSRCPWEVEGAVFSAHGGLEPLSAHIGLELRVVVVAAVVVFFATAARVSPATVVVGAAGVTLGITVVAEEVVKVKGALGANVAGRIGQPMMGVGGVGGTSA